MGVEVRPLGVKCNITCLYCYQNPIRDADNTPHRYDMDAMKRAIERQGKSFTLFGGEPLLVPLPDLEELWRFGHERFGKNGIQTNGTLITDAHIELFSKYRVHVGVSIDGPGELNSLRWTHSKEKTLEATQRTEAALQKLCSRGLNPSVIITLSQANASPNRLPELLRWVRQLDLWGIRSARLHTLEVDLAEVGERCALSVQEAIGAFNAFEELEAKLKGLSFDVFHDMRNMLLGADSNVTCVWGACDPYTTRAVQGIEGHGQTSNCGRTNKDGVEFTKSAQPGFERQLALYGTPQSHGGCQGCRFFLMCKGQCPGTAINGDWRNRSAECSLWYSLFETLESKLIADGLRPISVQQSLRSRLERSLMHSWAAGNNRTMAEELQKLRPEASEGHGDVPHGDHWGSPVSSTLTATAAQGAPASADSRGFRHGDARRSLG